MRNWRARVKIASSIWRVISRLTGPPRVANATRRRGRATEQRKQPPLHTLPGRSRGVPDSPMVYLTILLEKGHVTRRQVGKAYFYKAKTRERTAFRGVIKELAEQFCDGSIRSLLFNLVETEKLSQADIDELSRLAGEKKTAPKKGENS